MAGNISDQTTTLSNLAVDRNISAGTILGAFVPSTVSTTAAGASSFGTVTVATKLTLGSGTAVTKATLNIVPFVATTVGATKSTTTNATVSGLTLSDYILTSVMSSGVSNGVVVQAYCSAVDTLTIVFSNVSTAAANQIAGNLLVVSLRT